VAARVTDAGERIVLGQDCDRRPRALAVDRRPERRRQPAHAALDAGAVRFQEFGQPGVGPFLLERQLGRVVDAVREALQLVGQAVDRLGDLELERLDRRAHFIASNSARAFATSPGSASRS
jgi:hypothetical protein